MVIQYPYVLCGYQGVVLLLQNCCRHTTNVEGIQQVSCKAQGQPLSDRLYLRPINPQGKNNSGSETKINYYQGSNIIIGLWDLRPNMGEFGTLRAYPY